MKTTTSQRLKEIMESRSLRQIDILKKCEPFCEKYGVKLGRNDLSQYVSGKVIPGQNKLSILAMALNVDETYLMGYDVPPRSAPSPAPDPSADEQLLVSIYRTLPADRKQAVFKYTEEQAALASVNLLESANASG